MSGRVGEKARYWTPISVQIWHYDNIYYHLLSSQQGRFTERTVKYYRNWRGIGYFGRGRELQIPLERPQFRFSLQQQTLMDSQASSTTDCTPQIGSTDAPAKRREVKWIAQGRNRRAHAVDASKVAINWYSLCGRLGYSGVVGGYGRKCRDCLKILNAS